MMYSSGRATTEKQAKHTAGWLEKYTLVRYHLWLPSISSV